VEQDGPQAAAEVVAHGRPGAVAAQAAEVEAAPDAQLQAAAVLARELQAAEALPASEVAAVGSMA